MSNTVPDIAEQSDHHNYNRQREKLQRPYDLREFLNKKRQTTKDESKFNGLPSEPKYNFLSDPLRDGNDNPDQCGSGRFPPRNNYEYRVRARGRGRGRGRGYYQSNNNYRQNYKKEENIRGDQNSQDTLDGHKFEDINTNTANEGHTRYKTNSQFRPFVHRPHYQRKRYDQGNKFENSPQPSAQTGENSRRSEEDNPRNYTPRKKNSARGNQQYRPPNRFNPHLRGHQYKRNPKSLDPVNITVEYSVDSGTRKCMIEKNDSVNEEKNSQELKCVETECEENWDEDAYYDNEHPNKNEVVDETEIQVEIREPEENFNEKKNIVEEGAEYNQNKEEYETTEVEKQVIDKTENQRIVRYQQENAKTEEKNVNTVEEKQKIVKTEEKEVNTVAEKQDKTEEKKDSSVKEKQEIDKTKEENISDVQEKQEVDETKEEHISN